MKVEAPDTSVSDEEIDDWIERLRERFAELEPADRPVIDKDFVTVDIKATGSGGDLEDLERTDYLYFVGLGRVRRGPRRRAPGKKAGEILDVADEVPARYGEALAGTPVTYRVLVKDVKARKLPAVDDEFAKTASEFDTLAAAAGRPPANGSHELKEREAAGRDPRPRAAGHDRRGRRGTPRLAVDEETEHRIAHSRERAERSGVTLEQMLETQGWDEARLREDSRDHAIRGIKADLVLEGIARAADLEVTAEEIGAEIAGRSPRPTAASPKELAKQLDRSRTDRDVWPGISSGRKALDLLVERADIETEAESDEDAAPEGGPPTRRHRRPTPLPPSRLRRAR